MNRNVTALILIVLAAGIYFTFTTKKIEEAKAIKTVNETYQTALDNSAKLLKEIEKVSSDYNSISSQDREKLDKLLPGHVDNVRLIIDLKDDIAFRHGLTLEDISTSAFDAKAESSSSSRGGTAEKNEDGELGVMTISFNVTTSYNTFLNFLNDLESSLRILDISHLTITANEGGGQYDFGLEIKTYWLKQDVKK